MLRGNSKSDVSVSPHVYAEDMKSSEINWFRRHLTVRQWIDIVPNLEGDCFYDF